MARKIEIDFWNQLTMYPAEAGAYTGFGLDAIELLMDLKELKYMKKGKRRLIWRKDLDDLPSKLIGKQIDLKEGKIIDLEEMVR